MDDYTAAMQALSDSSRGAGHIGNRGWLDAYGQGEQRTWADYFQGYRNALNKDDPAGFREGGYAQATAGAPGNPQMQFYNNMMQRQMDSRMNEYQEWMKNYWQQQQQSQQALFDYLRQLYDGYQQGGLQDDHHYTPPGQQDAHQPGQEYQHGEYRGENYNPFGRSDGQTYRDIQGTMNSIRDGSLQPVGLPSQQSTQHAPAVPDGLTFGAAPQSLGGAQGFPEREQASFVDSNTLNDVRGTLNSHLDGSAQSAGVPQQRTASNSILQPKPYNPPGSGALTARSVSQPSAQNIFSSGGFF